MISTKKDYSLKEPLILLDKNKIEKHLKKMEVKIDIFEKIPSTNCFLKNHRDHDRTIKIVIAEMQTQGLGRLNRSWYSPFGQNIYLSMRYIFQKDISELSGLSLVVGLAVCRAIESVTHLAHLQIKWPNDIFIHQEKIAGILIESQAEPHGFCKAIIGISINVNMQEASKKQINQPWNSLQKIIGKYIDRNILCAELINQLIFYLERFSNVGLSDFMREWKQRDFLFKKSVYILSGQQKLNGIGSGINAHGHLILEMPDKTISSFSTGDATLLK